MRYEDELVSLHGNRDDTIRALRNQVNDLMRLQPETVTDAPTLVASNRILSLENDRLKRENYELHATNKTLRADLDYVQRQTRRLAYIATNVSGRIQEHVKEGRNK